MKKNEEKNSDATTTLKFKNTFFYRL